MIGENVNQGQGTLGVIMIYMFLVLLVSNLSYLLYSLITATV